MASQGSVTTFSGGLLSGIVGHNNTIFPLLSLYSSLCPIFIRFSAIFTPNHFRKWLNVHQQMVSMVTKVEKMKTFHSSLAAFLGFALFEQEEELCLSLRTIRVRMCGELQCSREKLSTRLGLLAVSTMDELTWSVVPGANERSTWDM